MVPVPIVFRKGKCSLTVLHAKPFGERGSCGAAQDLGAGVGRNCCGFPLFTAPRLLAITIAGILFGPHCDRAESCTGRSATIRKSCKSSGVILFPRNRTDMRDGRFLEGSLVLIVGYFVLHGEISHAIISCVCGALFAQLWLAGTALEQNAKICLATRDSRSGAAIMQIFRQS